MASGMTTVHLPLKIAGCGNQFEKQIGGNTVLEKPGPLRPISALLQYLCERTAKLFLSPLGLIGLVLDERQEYRTQRGAFQHSAKHLLFLRGVIVEDNDRQYGLIMRTHHPPLSPHAVKKPAKSPFITQFHRGYQLGE